LPILEVQPLPPVHWVVELLCCRCVGCRVNHVGLLENGEEGIVEDWRFFAQYGGQQDED
jgi:hypothetical protein